MWWFSENETKSLPASGGEYLPGCIDLMTEYSKDGLFLRLYYPTSCDKNQDNSKKFIPWIPDESYIYGIAKALTIAKLVIRVVFWWIGNIHIPVLYGEKVRVKNKLKCIIFSHGLGGHRFLYSNFCCELASRGFLIVAIEHRDGSASNTYYYKSKEDAEKDFRSLIRHKIIQFGEKHYEERNKQVLHRASECSKTLDFLINLNKGTVPYNVLDDVPQQKEITFQLSDLVGRLDLDSVTIAGHSFGGATALMTLAKRKEFKQGVLLDPWMFSIKAENLEENIHQPIIFINTQTFHISANVSAMEKFIKNDNQIYTILHTTHENQTDSVLLIGYWLNWFMKKLNAVTALKISHYLVLKFLNKHIGFPSETEEFNKYLEEQQCNIEAGLTKPWA